MSTARFLRANIFELQPLEVRRFLTIASIGASNTLNITGTTNSETITVSFANNVVSVSGVAGKTFAPGSTSGKFNKINIVADNGTDIIKINPEVPYDSSTINGGGGNDSITGGAKADRIIGDAGFDTTNYSARTSAVRVSLDGVANDGGNSGAEGDNVQTEEVIGGAGSDILTGSSGDDFLAGGAGADTIVSNAGNDELVGSTGADNLQGKEGDDAIYAKNNDTDSINGGTNADGGPGLDFAEKDAIDTVAGSFSGFRSLVNAAALSPSELDPTFDGDGKNTGPGLGWREVTAATVDSEGRTILVGYQGTGYGGDDVDFVATRYNADGSWDDTFAGDGEAVIDFTVENGGGYEDDDFALGVNTDTDGNIFIVGRSFGESVFSFNYDFAIVKLDETGAIDGTFGLQRYDVSGADDEAVDVVVQSDGNVVVVGTVDIFGENQDLAVMRLTPEGTPDGTFGSETGLVRFDETFDRASSVALQNLPQDEGAQRIVIGGVTNSAFSDDFLLVRFTPSGAVDDSFAGDGSHRLDLNDGSNDVLNDLVVNAANEIIAVGQSYFIAAFAERALQPEPAFGAGGVIAVYSADGSTVQSEVKSEANADLSFNAVDLVDDETLVIAGSDGEDFFVTRYTEFFTSDASFNGGQRFNIDFNNNEVGSSTDVALTVKALSDGKTLVGGYSDNSSDGLLTSVARLGVDDDGEQLPPEIEGTIDYDDVQNDPGTRRSTGATQYLKWTHLDDEGRAFIGLTEGNDTASIIKIINEEGTQQVALVVNGFYYYYDLDTTLITINGKGGNDVITVSNDVTVPVRLYGDNGNDVLSGGGGNDQVNGGAGNDLIGGGNGHDVMLGSTGFDGFIDGPGNDIVIGGLGSDGVLGGSGEDILIGGTTAYDDDPDALASLSAEWSRPDMTNAQRINNLRSGGGLNGSNVLRVGVDATVFDDNAKDLLTGGSGRDWFFRRNTGNNNLRDNILDNSNGEEITSL